MAAHLDMPIRVEHDVVELKVAVNDPAFVEKEQPAHDFSSVEPGPWLIKLARTLNLVHQVTTRDKLHHKEESIRGLEVDRGRVRTAEM